MKWLKPGKDNREERLNYVDYWAEYVRDNPDKVWSEQQNIIINSQIQNSRYSKLTPKQYLEIKGEL